MKRSQLLLLSMLMGILPVNVQNTPLQPDVVFPSQTAIKEHQDYIAHELTKKSYIKTGTQCLFGVSCVATCYMLFQRYSLVDTAHVEFNTSAACQWMKESLDAFKATLAGQELHISAPPAPLVRGWKELFYQVGSTVAQTVALAALQKFVVDQLLNTKTPFAWFVAEYTTLPKVYQEINVIKSDINCAKESPASITVYQADRYVTRLIFLSNSLIAEGQRVIGYFNHRYEHMLIQGKQLFGDDKSGAYLYDRMNILAERMHELREVYLQHTTHEERIITIAAMLHEIDSCGAELNSTTASFNRFDAQLAAV